MWLAVQVGEGVVYVAAGSNPANFGIQLANALQVIEQVPNPLALVYDYVLQFGGVSLSMPLPAPSDATLQTISALRFLQALIVVAQLPCAAVSAPAYTCSLQVGIVAGNLSHRM